MHEGWLARLTSVRLCLCLYARLCQVLSVEDPEVWVQPASFILVGCLVFSSVRGFLKQFIKVGLQGPTNHHTPHTHLPPFPFPPRLPHAHFAPFPPPRGATACPYSPVARLALALPCGSSCSPRGRRQ